jgi:hypothetical protein
VLCFFRISKLKHVSFFERRQHLGHSFYWWICGVMGSHLPYGSEGLILWHQQLVMFFSLYVTISSSDSTSQQNKFPVNKCKYGYVLPKKEVSLVNCDGMQRHQSKNIWTWVLAKMGQLKLTPRVLIGHSFGGKGVQSYPWTIF